MIAIDSQARQRRRTGAFGLATRVGVVRRVMRQPRLSRPMRHAATPRGSQGPRWHYVPRIPHCAGVALPQGQPGAVEPRTRLAVNSTEAAVDAALAGLGIIRVLEQVADELPPGSLQPILEEFAPEPMPVSLVHPHAGLLPLKTRAFLNWITPRLRARLQAIRLGAGEEGGPWNNEPAARAARAGFIDGQNGVRQLPMRFQARRSHHRS